MTSPPNLAAAILNKATWPALRAQMPDLGDEANDPWWRDQLKQMYERMSSGSPVGHAMMARFLDTLDDATCEDQRTVMGLVQEIPGVPSRHVWLAWMKHSAIHRGNVVPLIVAASAQGTAELVRGAWDGLSAAKAHFESKKDSNNKMPNPVTWLDGDAKSVLLAVANRVATTPNGWAHPNGAVLRAMLDHDLPRYLWPGNAITTVLRLCAHSVAWDNDSMRVVIRAALDNGIPPPTDPASPVMAWTVPESAIQVSQSTLLCLLNHTPPAHMPNTIALWSELMNERLSDEHKPIVFSKVAVSMAVFAKTAQAHDFVVEHGRLEDMTAAMVNWMNNDDWPAADALAAHMPDDIVLAALTTHQQAKMALAPRIQSIASAASLSAAITAAPPTKPRPTRHM